MDSKNVTIFKNIKETATPFHREVSVVLQRIKDGSSKELVKGIRQEKDKSARNELKKQYVSQAYSLSVTTTH